MPIIRIAAALITDKNRMLVVRKRGTRAFMQAGGKIEPGEMPLHALRRELREELGLTFATDPRHLGLFSAPAANEADHTVEADLFHLPLMTLVAPGAEIEETAWIDVANSQNLPLAPLTRDYVLPLMSKIS